MPAAEVCAFDVDRWIIWSSTQQVGCATTDVDGTFSITFRWCCGWWPTWWWRMRAWRYDSLLAERVGTVLQRQPDIHLDPVMSNVPTLQPFTPLLAEVGLDSARPLKPEHVAQLDPVRNTLISQLPAAPELAALKIWPWAPWYLWWELYT